jgi:hypothetical protein
VAAKKTKTATPVSKRRSSSNILSVAEQREILAKQERYKAAKRRAADRAKAKETRLVGAAVTVGGGLLGGVVDRWQQEQVAKGESIAWDVAAGVPAEGVLGVGIWAVATFALDKSKMSEWLADAGVGMATYAAGKLAYDMADKRYLAG